MPRGRALHLPVDAQGRLPRANLWGLAVPVVMTLDAAGLADVPRGMLAALADQLDAAAERCGPVVDSLANPAKALALELAGSLPYVWGASDVADVAAARMAAQLAENAKYPAVHGALTEVHHNQVVVMAGAFGDPGGRRRRHLPRPGRRRAGLAADAAAAAARHRRGAGGRGPRGRVARGRRALRRAVHRAARRG